MELNQATKDPAAKAMPGQVSGIATQLPGYKAGTLRPCELGHKFLQDLQELGDRARNPTQPDNVNTCNT